MGADIGAPVGGGADGGLHLLLEELRRVERIVERGDAAAGHEFLIWLAPFMSCSRVRRSTSSRPSAMAATPVRSV